ncbi:MAG: HlyD family efflux transporter periplasmic adaptor subunit [Deltaproteobacteria bacterium]|nr:HlyD family efflux transporter periplasmic adaptor subunit [Deltaproteobacteria bacterium]
MTTRLKRRAFLGLACAALAAGIVYAFLPQPVPVDTARVARGAMRVTVDDEGKTRVVDRFVVHAPITGRLQRIALEAGDAVKAGETVLAAIEPSDPALLDPRSRAEAEAREKAALAGSSRAAAETERAKAALAYARVDVERARKLAATGDVSHQALDQAELAERTAVQELRAAGFAEQVARFELETARATLMRAASGGDGATAAPGGGHAVELRSPVGGRVLRVLEESETVVAAGSPLVEVADPRSLEVVVDLLSTDAVQVHEGMAASLEGWGGPRALAGRVRRVEPSGFTKVSALGVEEQRVNVVIDLVEPPETWAALGDGFRVEARIVLWESGDALTVPTSALYRSKEDWAVFVVEGGRAHPRAVRVGHRNDVQAEAVDGLHEGDTVIVHPGDRITEGVSVVTRQERDSS